MKQVIKASEPAELSRWKAQANSNWTPTYQNLSGQVKSAVKTALMQEQGYICCYCERSLSEQDSHIEHLKPQSHADVDPLDYSNLLCSCQNQMEKGEPRHCGNLKADWYDEELLVSPLQTACEDRFSFDEWGHIFPAEADQAAQVTIQKLGLDLPKLVSLRAAAVEPFLDEILTPSELRQFASGYLQKDAQQAFNPFWSTIRQLFYSSQGDVL